MCYNPGLEQHPVKTDIRHGLFKVLLSTQTSAKTLRKYVHNFFFCGWEKKTQTIIFFLKNLFISKSFYSVRVVVWLIMTVFEIGFQSNQIQVSMVLKSVLKLNGIWIKSEISTPDNWSVNPEIHGKVTLLMWLGHNKSLLLY